MTNTAFMKKPSPWRTLVRNGFLVVFGLVMIYPVLWMVSSSLKSNADIATGGLLPKKFLWNNYIAGWNAIPGFSFTHFFGNSLVLVLLVVVGTVFSSSMVGYGFARLKFPLRKLWFGILMLTLMLPGQVTLIPQYILFKHFGWIGTIAPLAVPAFVAANPFFVFLVVQFIRGIPSELDESAKIDGCSPLGIYWRIILPLCRPAMITTAIFSFIWTWDDFFGQMIYLSNTARYTVPLALRLFLDNSSVVTWGPMFAVSVLSIIPCFVIFLVAQRYFVEGIATTGIK